MRPYVDIGKRWQSRQIECEVNDQETHVGTHVARKLHKLIIKIKSLNNFLEEIKNQTTLKS